MRLHNIKLRVCVHNIKLCMILLFSEFPSKSKYFLSMEYILNYAAIFCFGISPGTLVHSLNSVSLMNSIFDKIGTYIRENVRDRNLFEEADYMRKLVLLGCGKIMPR